MLSQAAADAVSANYDPLPQLPLFRGNVGFPGESTYVAATIRLATPLSGSLFEQMARMVIAAADDGDSTQLMRASAWVWWVLWFERTWRHGMAYRIRYISGPLLATRRERSMLRFRVGGSTLWMSLPFHANRFPGRHFFPGETVRFLVRPMLFRPSTFRVLCYARRDDSKMRPVGMSLETTLAMFGSLLLAIFAVLYRIAPESFRLEQRIAAGAACCAVCFAALRFLEMAYALRIQQPDHLE